MKRFTKLISSVLAALLTLSALVTVTNAKQFTDVPSTAPLLDAINYAVDNNFIEGTSSTTFSPNSYMTRGNMVLMLYRHSMDDNDHPAISFTDVPSNSIYADAVAWAVDVGITNGTSSTTFEPNTNIRRKHAAVMMYRYATYMVHRTEMTTSLNNFTDIASVTNTEILTALKWAVAAGIMNGTSSTTLEPNSYLKRGAAAAMLQRYGLTVEILRAPRVLSSTTISRNIYGFTNVSSNFFLSSSDLYSMDYYIDEADLDILVDNLVENGDDTPSIWNAISNMILNSTWRGSCYGMCISMMLDKAGQINVNGRVNNTLFLSEIVNLNNNARVESLINYYHVLQCLGGFGRYAQNDLQKLEQLYDSIYNNGLCEIVLWGNIDSQNGASGHSVVGYRSVSLGYDRYRIYVYDPNYTTMNTYLQYELDNGEVTSFRYYPDGRSDYEEITTFGFITRDDVIEMFKGYDIDGDYNTGISANGLSSIGESNVAIVQNDNSLNKVSLFANMVNESNTTLYITCDEDFTIINAQGDYLKYDSQTFSFSGNMILYRKAATDMNGFTHVLTVPADVSYEIITESDKVCFNVLSISNFNSIEATNAKSIKISENDEIIVSGNNAVVTSSYGTAKVKLSKEVK